MTRAVRQRFDFFDYIQLEEFSKVRHEYLDGMAWAMAGGSPEHARIAANISSALVTQLANRRCAIFSSDLRVRVPATGLATYSDVSVVCGQLELDPEDFTRHTVTNPKVVIEVLSPSTESYDRGEKLAHYQQLASLEEVVLVATEKQRIDVWRRTPEGWRSQQVEQGTVELESIQAALPLAAVYADPLAP
jgi:Uma2 family endonuclease